MLSMTFIARCKGIAFHLKPVIKGADACSSNMYNLLHHQAAKPVATKAAMEYRNAEPLVKLDTAAEARNTGAYCTRKALSRR